MVQGYLWWWGWSKGIAAEVQGHCCNTVQVHMKSAFPKPIKRHYKKWVSNAMPSSEIVFRGRAFHKYENIFIYAHIWSTLFQKTIYKFGIDIWYPYFWKRPFHIESVHSHFKLVWSDPDTCSYHSLITLSLDHATRKNTCIILWHIKGALTWPKQLLLIHNYSGQIWPVNISTAWNNLYSKGHVRIEHSCGWATAINDIQP